MVNLWINDKPVTVKEGSTILDAAKTIHINIPTLCHMKMSDGESVNCRGTCRICMVEVEGYKELKASCSIKVKEGMKVYTNTERVIESRKVILKLLLSNHPKDCLSCSKSLSCELQELASKYGVTSYETSKIIRNKIDSSTTIIRDENKCILCRRCVTACQDVQSMNVLTPSNRGYGTYISTFNDKLLKDTECTFCGQCVAVCPTGALSERLDYKVLQKVLTDKDKFVVVQIAPAVRVALSEAFKLHYGNVETKKIVTALKYLGFKKVFDTNFAADLTVMEESEEFIERLSLNKPLPMFTSCCPAWVRMMELRYPKWTHLLSSCKSPQQMFGAIAKEYLPKKLNIPKENLVVVSIMPCTAKKYEADREELKGDVDIVLTTRELSKLIKEESIDIEALEESDFDSPLGIGTGAGMIFGSTGGVMKAVIRNLGYKFNEDLVDKIIFKDITNLKGIKETTITLNNREFNFAIVSSLSKAQYVMNNIISGNNKYDLIEVMACPNGCVNGGGQPYIKSSIDKIKTRISSISKIDKASKERVSCNNPEIKSIYKELLERPHSRIAHELLHTKYKNKF